VIPTKTLTKYFMINHYNPAGARPEQDDQGRAHGAIDSQLKKIPVQKKD